MSGSSLTETDPALQIYEAPIVEKDQEIERLRQENERLRMENSNINQQELTQKVAKLEEDLADSKADHLQLKEQKTALHLNISKNDQLSDKVGELVANQTQNAVRTENKVEKQSGGQQNTSVLILGGTGCLKTIYLLDSKAQSWKYLEITLPMGMHSFGSVVLNEEIYIFGGYVNDHLQYCFKLKDDGSWMQLTSLNQKRSSICSSSLVYKGDIWAIGGYARVSGGPLKSVEKYDISQDKWTYMPEMNYARSHAAAAVFMDRIFVTGGYNKAKELKSVEMFDPKLQKWIFFCDLPIEVGGHTMLISNSTLSIFGGQSKSDSLNSVWEMDIEDPEKKWTEKQSLKQPRKFFGIGKLANGIIAFASWADGKTSETFDGNKWIDGPRLPKDLSHFAYTSIPQTLEESFLKKFS